MRQSEKAGWIAIGITFLGLFLILFSIGQRQGSHGRAAAKSACINNLRQIQRAVQPWALENKKKLSDPVNLQEVAGYLKEGVLPVCPLHGKYTVGRVDEMPVCSYPGHSL